MRIILFFLALSIGSTGMGQKIADPRPFANSISEASLRKHLFIVASKEFEGRETATEGQRKAAAYIENHFKSIGLLPGNHGSYQMEYPVYQDSLTDANLAVNEHPFKLLEDFDLSLSNYTSTLFSGEVVFAGYGITDSSGDDYQGLDVRGKVVLLLNSMPSARLQAQINNGTFNPFGKQIAAQEHGAIAVMIIQNDFPRKDASRIGHMYQYPYRETIRPNTYFVSEKVAQMIMGDDYADAKKGNIRAKSYSVDLLLDFRKTAIRMASSDVLGYLEGTDLKDQLLVISAHYDHLGKRDSVIYYGADDDGSGTVSVLEIASAFERARAAGKGPRRSILFLANSGEEKGLWGSEYYSEHPVYPMEKTTADLNIDMVGRIDPNRHYGDSTNYIYVVGDDKLSSDLKPISISNNKKYTNLELDYKFNDPRDPERIYFRSDHYNFARKGVPIIFYFDGLHHDYHRPTDTPDKINYDILAKRDKLIFYTAWEMANRNEMLKRDIPLR
ncbi:MAG: M28 family peptidase [Chitinophagales bacterium]